MIHKTKLTNPEVNPITTATCQTSTNNYFSNCEQSKIENKSLPDVGGEPSGEMGVTHSEDIAIAAPAQEDKSTFIAVTTPEDLCNWLDSLDELFLKDKKEQALVINELYNELKAPTSNEKVLLSLDNCLRKMAIINASNNIATVDYKISVQIATDILYSLNMISVERKKTEIVQKVIVSALNVLVDTMGKLQDLLSDGSDGSVEEAQRVFVGLIWSGTFVEYPSILEVLAKGLGNVNGSDTVIEVMICHSISDSLFGNDLQVQKVLKESLAKINFTDIENDLSVKFLNKMNITDPGATGKNNQVSSKLRNFAKIT